MKTIFKGILVASLLLPSFAAAQEDLQSYIDQVIKRAQKGSENITIENYSSASTGGQVAGAGQTVVTDGDVSASSHVETRINAGNSGGTVELKVETSKNGETKKEEYTKQVEPGKPVEVNISAKATSEGSKIEAKVDEEIVMDEEESASTTAKDTAELRVAIASRVKAAFKSVPTFFKKIFSFFRMW